MPSCRQADLDGGSPFRAIGRTDLSAMLFNNAVADTQAEAGSLPDALGRVERIEDSAGLFDSWSIVMKFGDNRPFLRSNTYFQSPVASALKHCVKRVIDHVEEDLLELMSVSNNRRQR